jgi:hypothetical protein
MYVHNGIVNKEIGFHTIGNSTSLSAPGSILKIFWREPVSISVKVIFLVDGQHDGQVSRFLCRVENSLGLTHVWICQRRDGLSHYQDFDGPFGVRFYFERFLRTDVS